MFRKVERSIVPAKCFVSLVTRTRVSALKEALKNVPDEYILDRVATPYGESAYLEFVESLMEKEQGGQP